MVIIIIIIIIIICYSYSCCLPPMVYSQNTVPYTDICSETVHIQMQISVNYALSFSYLLQSQHHILL